MNKQKSIDDLKALWPNLHWTTKMSPPPISSRSFLLLPLSLSLLVSSVSTDILFSISPVKPTVYVLKSPTPVNLELMWRLGYGENKLPDYVFTLQHKYARVTGGEGMEIVSKEFPNECPPPEENGFGQCGIHHFENRIIMFVRKMKTSTDEGYDALIVSIKNVTINDFNVDPKRRPGDRLEEKMKFEATMHSAVKVGESASSTIEVYYTVVDPNDATEKRNEEKQKVDYASIAVVVVVVLVCLVIAAILWAKRKRLAACVRFRRSGDTPEKRGEETKNSANGEAEKLKPEEKLKPDEKV